MPTKYIAPPTSAVKKTTTSAPRKKPIKAGAAAPISVKTKKPHRGIHPPEVARLRPGIPMGIPATNNAAAYGQLTDDSPYREYAWAFLRRNRYYQQLFDRKVSFPVAQWGYKPSPDHDFGYGLDKKKPYSEAFLEASEPEWTGIHTFERRLNELAALRAHAGASTELVEYPRQQVAVVFDLAPLLGAGSSALNIQIDRARDYLQKLRPTQGISTKRAKAPSKQLLRAQLRVADLLSSPLTLAVADEADPSSIAAKQLKTALEQRQTSYTPGRATPLVTSDIADLIPSFDLNRVASSKAKPQPSKEQRLKRVSELAVSAWRNMYCWELLTWLQYDDWTGVDLSPQKRKPAKSAKAVESPKVPAKKVGVKTTSERKKATPQD